MQIATYLRLSGATISGIWRGTSNEGADLSVIDNQPVPNIYFHYQGKPYYKYEREPEVVEKITQREQVTVANYLNWIDLQSLHDEAKADFSTSPVTADWQKWAPINEQFAHRMESVIGVFSAEQDGHLELGIAMDDDSGTCLISVREKGHTLYTSTECSSLSQEERRLLHTESLKLCDAAGKYLRELFLAGSEEVVNV